MSHLITIDEIVSKTTDLPSIPAAAVRVMRETEASTSSASSIAGILAQDQALSARVLRLANSAFYGLSRKVSDLPEAVVVLGMRSIKNLAMVASTYPWMSRPLSGYQLDAKEMWIHAFGTAIGAQLIAKRTRACKDDVAFTAGLLHDIGKVALSIWLENKIGAILLYASREGLTFDQAERKVLGFDHTQVGEQLASSWNLPDEIVSSIRYHHAPSEANPPQSLTDCVHIGNYLTLMMGYGLGGDGHLYTLDESALFRLGIRTADLDAIKEVFADSYETHEKLFEDMAAA